MRSGQEAARRFHEEPERSSDFLCLPDLEDFLFCLRKKNMLSQESQKMYLECSVAIKCHSNFSIRCIARMLRLIEK